MLRPLIVLPLALGLAACASVPRPLQGAFDPIPPPEAASRTALGADVRWGGRILEIEPGADRTCFTVLAQPLDAGSRPLEGDRSLGRFIACRTGFYDPAVFAPGRSLTVTGRIAHVESRPVGEFAFAYPVLEAAVLYLWPDTQVVEIVHADPFWPIYRPWPWGGHYRSYRVPRKAEAEPPAR